MSLEQATMMLELQQLGLTMDDLRIYLDSHLYDKYAIERYNMAAERYANLAEQYSSRFSPLISNMTDSSNSEWLWGLSDFPWDY